MNDEELKVLNAVKNACKQNPRFLESVIRVGTEALIEKAEEANIRACDMETIALAACAQRYGNRLSFIKEKISKIKTSFVWDSVFSKSEK